MQLKTAFFDFLWWLEYFIIHPGSVLLPSFQYWQVIDWLVDWILWLTDSMLVRRGNSPRKYSTTKILNLSTTRMTWIYSSITDFSNIGYKFWYISASILIDVTRNENDTRIKCFGSCIFVEMILMDWITDYFWVRYLWISHFSNYSVFTTVKCSGFITTGRVVLSEWLAQKEDGL